MSRDIDKNNSSNSSNRSARYDDAYRRPRNNGAVGSMLGKYQSVDEICTKEAADLLSGQVSSAAASQQRYASPPQMTRGWSSIGHYTADQRRIVPRRLPSDEPQRLSVRRDVRDNSPGDDNGDQEAPANAQSERGEQSVAE